MRYPVERLSFAQTIEGKSSEKGFLVLNIHGMDLEGVHTLTLEVKDVEKIILQGDKQETEKKRVRDLLGG
jgi:hypothetical protein